MTKPIISVLIPVYNAEKYLAKAIESILSQTFPYFELIIIDDGSTDKSLEIIKNYANSDERIKYISRENKGLIYTRNEGIELAQGKYIALMDADDISLPDRLEQQYNYLEKHDDYIAVGSFAALIDSDGDDLCDFGQYITHDEIDKAHLDGFGGAIINPTAFIKREAIQSINGYSKDYPHAEDFDFWLRLAEIGRLTNIPKVMLFYRQHVESVGYAKRESQIKSTQKAIYDAYVRRNLNPDSTKISLNKIVLPTKLDIYLKWGWWAMHGKNLNTARKYAVKILKSAPWKKEAWKLLFCSYRGY